LLANNESALAMTSIDFVVFALKLSPSLYSFIFKSFAASKKKERENLLRHSLTLDEGHDNSATMRETLAIAELKK
jgi:hypothetical protein